MSGFFATLDVEGEPVDPGLVARMTEHLEFRGPDGTGSWSDGSVAMGHALLQTTPESVGETQPLSFDGRVRIVASARVDGRAELLAALRGRGRQADLSAPDVALILHSYHAWGVDCVDHLIGDYSFAIWDPAERRLFCANDHFGVMPLYWAWIGGRTLVVSNTLSCVRAHPGVGDELNDLAIADFLVFGANQEPTTTSWADIRRLPPTHRLVCVGSPRVERYWTPPEISEPVLRARDEEYVEGFRSLFEQAVSDRLRTDKVALQLSGGMDTTSIAAMVRELGRTRGQPVDCRAYTMVWEHLIPDDEGHYATLVAGELGIPIELIAAESFLEVDPTGAPDRPPSEPSYIPARSGWLETGRRGAAHARVLLSGFGGDPLLSAVPAYRSQLLRRGRWRPLLQYAWHELTLMHRLPRLGLRSSLGRRLGLRSADDRPQPSPLPPWLSPDLIVRCDLRRRVDEISRGAPPTHRHGMFSAPLWSYIFHGSNGGSSDLHCEARFPFFDLRLVRFAMSLPPVPWLEHKRVLRAAMGSLLPVQVVRRKKTLLDRAMGPAFSAARGVREWMLAFLAHPGVRCYVDPATVALYLRASRELQPGQHSRLHSVLALAYWLDYHRAGREARELVASRGGLSGGESGAVGGPRSSGEASP